LYFPNVEPTKREKPEMFQNLPKLRRLEKSSYEPNDMWDAEDNLLFLKYCPISRDRCYHSIACDTSARPHELLNLKIKDVEFIEGDKGRYAKILVNGKTGQRSLPLVDSIPRDLCHTSPTRAIDTEKNWRPLYCAYYQTRFSRYGNEFVN